MNVTDLPAVVRDEVALLAGAADRALPAYITDIGALRADLTGIRAALPCEVELLYAAKANPDPAVLAAVAGTVDGIEVASGGELSHVHAAVPGCPLTFGGPGKTTGEIDAAVGVGVHRFHVESAHELHLLSAAAQRAQVDVDVLLRANPAIDLGPAPLIMGGRPTPFGSDGAGLDVCLSILAGQRRVRLRGVHAHLASGLSAPEHLALAAQVLTWVDRWKRDHHLDIDEVNLGGGMAVDYANPHDRFGWEHHGHGLRVLGERFPGMTLRLEPGRALTAYCGWYATRVLDIKANHGATFAVLAGGTHHLRTPAARAHDQPFAIVPVDRWDHRHPRPGTGPGPVTFVGQLCTPRDVLARDVVVDGVRVGDIVVFAMAGAYAWNISHRDFLMHPHPAFRVLDDAIPV